MSHGELSRDEVLLASNASETLGPAMAKMLCNHILPPMSATPAPESEGKASKAHKLPFFILNGVLLQDVAGTRSSVVAALTKAHLWPRVVELCGYSTTWSWRLAVPCLRFLQQMAQDHFQTIAPKELSDLSLSLPTKAKKRLLMQVQCTSLVQHATSILKSWVRPDDDPEDLPNVHHWIRL